MMSQGFPSTVVNVKNKETRPGPLCMRNHMMCQIQDIKPLQGSAINEERSTHGQKRLDSSVGRASAFGVVGHWFESHSHTIPN